MDVIDGNWISARFTGRHGEKAELADAIGMDRDKLTKVLKGKRRLTPEEIASVTAYFRQSTAAEQPHIPLAIGFSEEAAAFSPQRAAELAPGLRLMYGAARNPQAAFRATAPIEALAILRDDLLICDLGRAAATGDTVILTVADVNTGETSAHLIRRYLSPWLLDALDQGANPLRHDDPRIFIRYPVIGILRGCTHSPA